MNVLDNYSKDILTKARYGFQWNCKRGHLSVAKWLYYSNQCNIDIDVNQNQFIKSCKNGHLPVAKWLYSLGKIDIRPDDRYTFMVFDKNVLDWLNTLSQKIDYLTI